MIAVVFPYYKEKHPDWKDRDGKFNSAIRDLKEYHVPVENFYSVSLYHTSSKVKCEMEKTSLNISAPIIFTSLNLTERTCKQKHLFCLMNSLQVCML